MGSAGGSGATDLRCDESLAMRILSAKEQGYTLMEMVLVIVIIGILAVMIGTPLIRGSLAWQTVSARKDATQQARLGMDRMVRELRNVQADASNNPVFNGYQAAPACIIFTNLSGTLVGFRQNGTDIVRMTGAGITCTSAGTTLVSNVGNFTITCYNVTNAVLAGCAPTTDIRRLLLQTTVQVGSEPVSLDSQVMLRSELGV